MPGVILEPHSNVKMPMVRKPVHMIKPRVVTLQKSLHNSLERRHGLKEESFSPSLKRNVVGTIPLSSQHEKNFGERHRKEQEKSKKQLSLKELNPQDKKRVANLVKELAKVGEERVHAEERLQVERTAFEERLAILQEEYDAVIKEKHHLQKRFVELQALLVKYQTNGRTPSPRKPVNSPPNKEEEKHQVWGVLSSASPSKPPDLSSSKSEPAKVTGNTRPSDTEHASDKFRSPTRLPLHVTPQVRNNDSVLLNNDNKRQLGKTSSKGSPLYHSSVSSGHARESIPGKSNLSQAGQIAAGASSEHLPLPIPTTAEEMSPSRGQSLEIPQSSCPKEEPNSHSLNPHETSTNTSSFVTAHRHPPSAVIPQPAMHPGPAVMSQYPPQAKPVFSVFGDGVSEPRIPPRKNEDRSFSEASGVSGSFSAELDAVYRLYCREYELQLQLQQQQIELQKQQLQLQQQLQQVEALQQQQQQKQQQQSSGKSPNYVPAATQAMARADHEKHLKTVVEETPAPSPVPRPSSQPRQVSPARSLIPTPEGSSSILSNGRLLPKTDLQTPRTESTVGSYVSRDQAPPEAEVSGTLPLRSRKNRMEPEKENRNPLVSDPHGRVMSAPPSLGHSRSNFERYQMHRHREEFSVPAVYSNDERVISGCGRNSMAHDPQTSGNMDGRVSADYHASGLLSSSYSLHSRSRDVSDIRENASPGERKGQDFCVEPDMLSGKASDDLFYSSSNYESNIDRASSTAKRFQTGSFLNGARISNAQPPFPEPRSLHPQMQGSFDRQNVGSDQRFSLYSDVQSRDDMFPDGDVRTYGPRMVEKSQDREPLDSAYPLSLVDIVDGLENETEKHTAPCRDPGKAEGLDTSDSGYSQDTYKERSPLTSESVNTDEEEAAVLEDIFFLTARF